MTVEEFFYEIRQRLDEDQDAPARYTDVYLLELLNDAVQHYHSRLAQKRADYPIQSRPGVGWYDIPEQVIKISEVRDDDWGEHLGNTNHQQLGPRRWRRDEGFPAREYTIFGMNRMIGIMPASSASNRTYYMRASIDVGEISHTYGYDIDVQNEYLDAVLDYVTGRGMLAGARGPRLALGSEYLSKALMAMNESYKRSASMGRTRPKT